MGNKIEGLLLNSRMVQGIFDDYNEETKKKWKYPDMGPSYWQAPIASTPTLLVNITWLLQVKIWEEG